MTICLFLNCGNAWYDLGCYPCKQTTICLLHCSFLVSLFGNIVCASIIRILGIQTTGICTVRPVDPCFSLCLVNRNRKLFLPDLCDVRRVNFFHVNFVSVTSVVSLTLRLLMSYIYIYIYIYGTPILDVSRSHTTTQHSR